MIGPGWASPRASMGLVSILYESKVCNFAIRNSSTTSDEGLMDDGTDHDQSNGRDRFDMT